MLFSRLVTGRYGYEAVEEQPRRAPTASGQGWVSRLMTMLLVRKKAGT